MVTTTPLLILLHTQSYLMQLSGTTPKACVSTKSNHTFNEYSCNVCLPSRKARMHQASQVGALLNRLKHGIQLLIFSRRCGKLHCHNKWHLKLKSNSHAAIFVVCHNLCRRLLYFVTLVTGLWVTRRPPISNTEKSNGCTINLAYTHTI